MRSYFYRLIYKYLSLYVFSEDTLVEVDPPNDLVITRFDGGFAYFRNAAHKREIPDTPSLPDLSAISALGPDFILLHGLLHYERDIQQMLSEVRGVCRSQTRVIIVYYSMLWKPLMKLASRLGLRTKMPEINWIAHEDVDNLLLLSGFEAIRRESRILMPLPVPLLASFINRFLSPLPFFRYFNMINIAIGRPVGFPAPVEEDRPSVSIVVPARNESGNIEAIVDRLPAMGPDDELIFIEGNSTDDTWEKIQEVKNRRGEGGRIRADRQDGTGKGDAVRKGFDMASKEILMILDADMTVPPEDLPKFYEAIICGKGEFINGSRLVYPMEQEAMRFFNLMGNKFFATAFSFVLGQRFKDTLCGTKVLTRENYRKLAKHRTYFGDFDPFGDFDLIFGSARMCLKIIEIPIVYRARTYGDTNISRWRHGAILLRMLLFSARKIKFI